MPTPHRTFPLMSANAFVSTTDKAALDNLQKMPILPLIVRKFHESLWDNIDYARNSAESIRCSEKQFPTLYRMLKEACATLDVPEPELYVRYSPTYNAYTSGVSRTYIVLQSSLLDAFTDEELAYIIGHELGHIKCGHVLYLMLARLIMPLLEEIGQVTLGLGKLAGMGLMAGFLEWMRQAEFSCDRAGLLVCQDVQVGLNATLKLGAGSTRFHTETSTDAFLEQAQQHSDNNGLNGVSKAILFMLYTWQLEHPQVVYRAKGLDDWVKSGKYDEILNGQYEQDLTGGSQLGAQHQCPKCKTVLSSTIRYCPNCGEDTQSSTRAAHKHCETCNVDLPPDVRFCTHCGNRV